MTLEPTTSVWRYMSFAKFVWMLQKKRLWLSSFELLEDRWEGMPIGQQLNIEIGKQLSSVPKQDALNRITEIVKTRRRQTFVSCWNASEHESHALWRIYCNSSEGVAIQTTLDRLKKSVSLPVVEVTYSPHEIDDMVKDARKLATQKRPMFSYEQYWFAETVEEIVRRFAPKLSSRLWYSEMSHRPPF